MGEAYEVVSVPTTSYDDQKPGTSGLRKPTRVFLSKPNYTENFIQSILSAIPFGEDGVLVVGGDGRYFMKDAIKVIVKIAAANGVRKLIIGQNGLLSTPAVSCIIRKYSATGGIILTASHNPGGPAPSKLTDKIYEVSKQLQAFNICPNLNIDLSFVGHQTYIVGNHKAQFEIDIISSVADYVELMKDIFDFPALKKYIQENNLSFRFDALHGVVGPYAKSILCDELGCSEDSLTHCVPKEDFGGSHPDPNLTYARDLVLEMQKGVFDFGAAFDGDGDRNMLIGKDGFYVSPCDSLAIIANNYEAIPYFLKHGLKGVARSMPTSGALDRVAVKLQKNLYETPTGWKFFGNLMDAGKLSLCGEESFGTGSDHIREKDGLWAALAWLSILMYLNKNVEQTVKCHWKEFGRNCFTRYDYEQVDTEAAAKVLNGLRTFVENRSLINTEHTSGEHTFVIDAADDFEYVDPIDHDVSKNQGIRILFKDGSRLIFRLSGTGSSGATIRMYIDSFLPSGSVAEGLHIRDGRLTKDQTIISFQNAENLEAPASEALKPLVEVALRLSKIQEYTGRVEPTVIT